MHMAVHVSPEDKPLGGGSPFPDLTMVSVQKFLALVRSYLGLALIQRELSLKGPDPLGPRGLIGVDPSRSS